MNTARSQFHNRSRELDQPAFVELWKSNVYLAHKLSEIKPS